MRYTGWPLALLLLAGCASLGQGDSTEMEREETWTLAHQALAVEDFDRAAALFDRLVTSHADSNEGREAVFYLGAIRLDPRNPNWNPVPAEEYLRQYLAVDSIGGRGIAGRGPEARTLLELAAQLNMPASERVPGLQPETRVVEAAPQRVVVPAAESRALAAEVARLRRELEARDATIKTQRDEIERIRKTLTGREGG